VLPLQRLQRELRNLNTKTQLPIHSAAAIFVRHDPDRIDKMRVVITGAAFNFLRIPISLGLRRITRPNTL
jgi:hypothetical protein